MRLPGTLKALLEQVKKSPVPLGSISIPMKDGPLTLTFGDRPAPAVAKAEPSKLTLAKPLRQRDTVGAFAAPPLGREEPFTPLEDSQ